MKNFKKLLILIQLVFLDENSGNDDGSDSIELSPRQKQMLEKHFEKQEKFLDGDVQKTKLNKKESSDIKSIEESGATYENVGDGIPNDYLEW